MVFARLIGSLGSNGSGRPWATSQKLQRLVHLSPIIIKVAVPWLKHSERLGQAASSQAVTSVVSRRIFFKLATAGVVGIRIRIQSGLREGSIVGSILIGIRANFSAPRCFGLVVGALSCIHTFPLD